MTDDAFTAFLDETEARFDQPIQVERSDDRTTYVRPYPPGRLEVYERDGRWVAQITEPSMRAVSFEGRESAERWGERTIGGALCKR